MDEVKKNYALVIKFSYFASDMRAFDHELPHPYVISDVSAEDHRAKIATSQGKVDYFSKYF